MSVSNKVLRKMKRVMGVIGASVVSSICASQVSFADYYSYYDGSNNNSIMYGFDTDEGTLYISGEGNLTEVWKEGISYLNGKLLMHPSKKEYVTEEEFKKFLKNNPKYKNYATCGVRRFSQSVKKVVIADGSNIAKIGKKAFHKCGKLEEFTIPKTVKSIDEGAFSESGLTGIIIPKSVEKIGGRAFEGCRSLKEAKLEYGVKELGEKVFKYCISLESLVIPTSVKVLGDFILNNSYHGTYQLGIKSIVIVNDSGLLWSVDNIKIVDGVDNFSDRENLSQISIEFNVHDNISKYGVCGYKFNRDDALRSKMPIYDDKWDLNGISKMVTWLCAMNESWDEARNKKDNINTPAPTSQTHEEQKYQQPESSSEAPKTPMVSDLVNKFWSIFTKK